MTSDQEGTEHTSPFDAIGRIEACKQSGHAVSDHLAHLRKMVSIGLGAKRQVEDVHLSRYGAYLTAQNADTAKPIAILGQTYFAVQTRCQEIADELVALSEDQKRLLLRSGMVVFHRQFIREASKFAV